MKRLLVTLLIVSILLSFTACGGSSSSSSTTAASTTTTTASTQNEELVSMEFNAYKEFVFTYYYGPDPDACTESIVKLIADCGFTRMALQGRNNPKKVKKIAGWAAKYGMDICLYLHTELGLFNARPADRPVAQDKVDAAVQKILNDYEGIDNIVEFQLRDEPPTEHFEALAAITDAFHRLDKRQRPVLVNLYPFSIFENPSKYLSDYVEICSPDALSFDGYHFKGDPVKLVEPDVYLNNLHLLMEEGREHNLPTTMIVLASQHLSFSYLEEPQLRWEANLNLVYGCNGVSYFTFKSLKQAGEDPDSKNGGLVTYGYEPTEQYYFVQNISKDIIPVGNQLVDKTVSAVFQINTGIEGETHTPDYESYGDLGRVDGSNGMVGFYDDGSFYLMNFEYKSDAKANVFGLNDLSGDALEWFDSTDSAWKSFDSCTHIAKTADGFTVTLDSGDAILLRVKK